jgi:CubicO group peptidase (beta-lactamase class C family)
MRLKKIALFGILTIIFANLLILVTDRTYLYKGIANTYLKGRKGPGIFDLEAFKYRVLSLSKDTFPEKLITKKTLEITHVEALEKLGSNSFLVYQNDSLLVERYWNSNSETVSNSFSVAKSILGILTGIAIKEGFIKSMQEPVGNYIPHFTADSLQFITIHHLLSMSSGIHWIESGANPFSHNAKAYYGTDLTSMMNEIEYEKKPGITFEYKSGNSQILAMVLAKATEMNVSQFATKYLWKRIGATQDAFWSLDDENGVEKAFCCMYATGHDFAKLGMLMNHEGNVQGNQLLDSSFVSMSTKPASLKTMNGKENAFYGLHWWVFNSYKNLTGYYARGILGQYIIVIPSQNIVIVRTGHQRMGKSDGFHPDDLYIYLDIARDLITDEKRY